MTDQIDTSTEAVERLANALDRHLDRKRRRHERNPNYKMPDSRYVKAVAVLRALAAKQDALKAREKALVAAAYEKAASSLMLWRFRELVHCEDTRHAIRALTPDDARAARDRMRAEAEARGVAKERERCAGVASAYGGGNSYAAKMIAAAIREGEG